MAKKRLEFSILYFVAAVGLIFVAQYFVATQTTTRLSYSQFKTLLKRGQVTDLVIRDKEISGSIKPEAIKELLTPQQTRELGERVQKPVLFVVVRVEDARLTAELEEAGVPFKGETTNDWLATLLSWILPIIIFFALWSFLANRMALAAG